ncbi:GNAT family N-acetyltransferase [Nocardiopsis sediminis]|uniref:GNAT family N-acetyltransferase n=1 Tax=Nocardiopsis sediminis TaxID=1778267 RepID=A0ABV8FQ22_9ACTN
MHIEIHDVDWDHPEGARLRRDQQREVAERYGGADTEAGPKPSGRDTALFLLATDVRSGEAVGCGGLRALDDDAFELKRMYVVPAWRGRRVGQVLLRALEEAARERGASVMRLETGSAQGESIRLYERCGYRRIERYGHYADSEVSVCFERSLTGDPQPAAG